MASRLETFRCGRVGRWWLLFTVAGAVDGGIGATGLLPMMLASPLLPLCMGGLLVACTSQQAGHICCPVLLPTCCRCGGPPPSAAITRPRRLPRMQRAGLTRATWHTSTSTGTCRWGHAGGQGLGGTGCTLQHASRCWQPNIAHCHCPSRPQTAIASATAPHCRCHCPLPLPHTAPHCHCAPPADH